MRLWQYANGSQSPEKTLNQINVIHWSGGHHKPWKNPAIVYGEIWQKYAPPAALLSETKSVV